MTQATENIALDLTVFPAEAELEARVDEVRMSAPESEELVDAILDYIAVAWVRVEAMRPYIEEAIQVSESIGYELGRARALVQLAFRKYFTTKYEEALPILAEALPVILDHGETVEWGRTMLILAALNQVTGSYDQALEYGFKLLDQEDFDDQTLISWMYYRVADIYRELGDTDEALKFAQRCFDGFTVLHAKSGWLQHRIGASRGRTQLAAAFEAVGQLDDALAHNETALAEYREAEDRLGEARALTDAGRVFIKAGDDEQGERLLKEALELRRELGHRTTLPSSLLALGNLNIRRGNIEEAVGFLKEAVSIADEANLKMRAYQAHEALARAYKAEGNVQAALEHFEMFHELKEEVAGEAINLKIHNRKVLLEINRAEREAEIERAKATELADKNAELARLLAELKSTQDRLVQSEKMASLGRLTAGIAHEIRNPLNFVNNFSALSSEMVQEMEELLRSSPDQLNAAQRAELEEDLKTLVFNTDRIREHGARADAIVESMIEHSRTGNPRRMKVNPNELLEEYVQLAYYAQLTTDDGFPAYVYRNYDETASDIECVPTEIGRVLLNIIGNAFDALKELGPEGGIPTITVSSAKIGPRLEIRISDNGPGITEDVRSRIFEPFFTTKPTGSGTGLGLSMSYDIVTKGHGGELEVFSRPGKGATFIIRLPS